MIENSKKNQMNINSWGKLKSSSCYSIELNEILNKKLKKNEHTLLAIGETRSYGDSCLNTNQFVFFNKYRNKILDFDSMKQVITVESGISFDELLKFLVPRGFFVPVTPGTKFISVGGAIANDVHGKNHELKGNFGNHVQWLTLLKSNGQLLKLSPHENSELFWATIGGLGLTGVILDVCFKIVPIDSSYIINETIKFNSFDEFLEINQDSKKFEFTVAWLDCLNGKGQGGRGLYMRGDFLNKNHSLYNKMADHKINYKVHQDPKLSVPIEFPSWVLNPISMKAFNFLYFHKQISKVKTQLMHYDPFFYPLDAINSWNNIYGRQGFYQFQFVLPLSEIKNGYLRIYNEIINSQAGSFLAVLKTFGKQSEQGLLSFPEPGLTLALDFANKGEKTKILIKKLEDIITDHGGKIYPAKDALMSFQHFHQMYKVKEFLKFKDPNFESDFSRRNIS